MPGKVNTGNERAFLTWFYEGATADRSIEPATSTSIFAPFPAPGACWARWASTAPPSPARPDGAADPDKIEVPVVALGGSANGLGAKVGEMVKRVAANVEAHTLADSGHFLPAERPDGVIEHILAMAAKTR